MYLPHLTLTLHVINLFQHSTQNFEKCFPLNTRVNINTMPINKFMTPDLLKLRAKNLRLLKRYRLSPSTTNKENSRIYRNFYNGEIRKGKLKYYKDLFAASGSDSKVIWNIINQLMNKKPKSSGVDSLNVDGVHITDEQLIADKFNLHFASIGQKVADELPTASQDFRDFLPEPEPNDLVFEPLQPFQLVQAINLLKAKKSLDINGYSSFLIQKVATEISHPFTHVYNLSIRNGVFPHSLKISKCTPIFKNGDKLDTNNYRGISLVNVFSKVFEKLISDRLVSFLSENGFFNPLQFGFLKGRSTSQAILQVINNITSAINEREYVLAIFLDIRKAFDSVDHEILLAKLENAGVRGRALLWFRSFISNRSQRVKIGNTLSSNLLSLAIGVLQGSILGVILFLLFINDIQGAALQLLKIFFADDITALISSSNLIDLINNANIQLKSLVQWYSASRLSIHPLKSKAILFKDNYSVNIDLSPQNGGLYLPVFLDFNTSNPSAEDLALNLLTDITKIKPLNLIPNNDESFVKSLGILLDSKLKFTEHVSGLHGKMARAIFSINQIKNFLGKDLLKNVYYAHFHSHLNFISTLLSCISSKQFKSLAALQRRVIRILAGAAYNADTIELFYDLNILPLEQLIIYNISCIMYDYNYGNLPESFIGTWIRNNEYHNIDRELRNANDLRIQPINFLYLADHPLINFPKVWNSLSNDLKTTAPKGAFKSKLKSFLFQNLLDTLP